MLHARSWHMALFVSVQKSSWSATYCQSNWCPPQSLVEVWIQLSASGGHSSPDPGKTCASSPQWFHLERKKKSDKQVWLAYLPILGLVYSCSLDTLISSFALRNSKMAFLSLALTSQSLYLCLSINNNYTNQAWFTTALLHSRCCLINPHDHSFDVNKKVCICWTMSIKYSRRNGSNCLHLKRWTTWDFSSSNLHWLSNEIPSMSWLVPKIATWDPAGYTPEGLVHPFIISHTATDLFPDAPEGSVSAVWW